MDKKRHDSVGVENLIYFPNSSILSNFDGAKNVSYLGLCGMDICPKS